MAIKCCKNCVAPKRKPGCHDHCPEYLAEKAQEEKEKAQYKKDQKVNSDIYQQRIYKIEKAKRRHGRM